ncbi:hypothetical protein KIW84_023064 [Lathyrus oleraceus]|uniref:Uncharacterized protein n=1 Tax=Pisum sativum TaxID=3888 RepID=A0A9D4YC09_PEA|nr:hypothetical protein KIW84_023063 [Pisum sativum]KAI5436799.1 hypothetical protein KIW84_023064 [Pisum sativum]
MRLSRLLRNLLASPAEENILNHNTPLNNDVASNQGPWWSQLKFAGMLQWGQCRENEKEKLRSLEGTNLDALLHTLPGCGKGPPFTFQCRGSSMEGFPELTNEPGPHSAGNVPESNRRLGILSTDNDIFDILPQAKKRKYFMKNLYKTFDSRALHDTFSTVGRILFCEMATVGSGQSKGFKLCPT